MNGTTEVTPLIEAIPKPDEVREQIGKTLQQLSVLRHLLKTSERAERAKAKLRPEVAVA